MDKLIDIQGIQAGKVFAILCFAQDYWGENNYPDMLGIGTRRQVLQACSKTVSHAFAVRSWDGHYLSEEEFLQMADDACRNAIPVEQFLAENDITGLRCCLRNKGNIGDSDTVVAFTSQELESWILSIPEDRREDALISGLGLTQFARETETTKYIVRNGRMYYGPFCGGGMLSRRCNMMGALKMSKDEAIEVTKEEYDTAEIIACTPRVVCYAIKLAAGKFTGQYIEEISTYSFETTDNIGYAQTYSSKSSARKVMKHIPSDHAPVVMKFSFNEDGSDCIEET